MRWRSCAKWAPALRFDHDITTDTHDTKEQAEAVCSMLRQWGLGGQGNWFPVETWTEPVEQEAPNK